MVSGTKTKENFHSVTLLVLESLSLGVDSQRLHNIPIRRLYLRKPQLSVTFNCGFVSSNIYKQRALVWFASIFFGSFVIPLFLFAFWSVLAKQLSELTSTV